MTTKGHDAEASRAAAIFTIFELATPPARPGNRLEPVYRAARDKKLDHAEARSLVWMPAQMRGMVETQALERLKQRLEELAPSIEEKPNGYTGSRWPRSSRTAN
jgi:hypothetical protein